MDITNLFHASVKTMKLRKKLKPLSDEVRTPRKCPFSEEARQIVKTITELRDFLFSHRKEYININPLWTGGSQMSELERDKIDSDAMVILGNCKSLTDTLKKKVDNYKQSTSQLKSHHRQIALILDSYLAGVSKILKDQKVARVKRVAEMKKMSRLEYLVRASTSLKKEPAELSRPNSSSKLSNGATGPLLLGNLRETSNRSNRTEPLGDILNRVEKAPEKDISPSNIGTGLRQRNEGANGSKKDSNNLKKDDLAREKSRDKRKLDAARIQDEMVKKQMEQLSPVEHEQLSKENDQLYEKLNAMEGELEVIDKKVTDISELNQRFQEAVSLQQDSIMRINEVAIHTTENISYGNEQIRQAMKNKSAWRVYILFFLIVLTFTLLFLDWFNP